MHTFKMLWAYGINKKKLRLCICSVCKVSHVCHSASKYNQLTQHVPLELTQDLYNFIIFLKLSIPFLYFIKLGIEYILCTNFPFKLSMF